MASTATPPKEQLKDILPIVVALPPNFDAIKLVLPHANHTHTYCYDGTIYNPSGKKLSLDIQYHEYIHSLQQEERGVEAWWQHYLTEPSFRLEQEIDAYGSQYAYAKKNLIEADEDTRIRTRGKSHIGGGVNNILTQLLFSMATALSGKEYGSLLSFSAAEAAIKRYGR